MRRGLPNHWRKLRLSYARDAACSTIGGGHVSHMHEMWLAQPLEEAASQVYERCGFLQWLGKLHLVHIGDTAPSNPCPGPLECIHLLLLIHTCSSGYWFDGRLTLRVANARQLHELIIEHYQTWLRNAPADYTDDGFFNNSIPIVVTLQCGQNQKICQAMNGPLYDEDLTSWMRLWDFSEVRYLSIVIASQAS